MKFNQNKALERLHKVIAKNQDNPEVRYKALVQEIEKKEKRFSEIKMMTQLEIGIKEVKKIGGSCHILLPKKYMEQDLLGKKVLVLLLNDKPVEESGSL